MFSSLHNVARRVVGIVNESSSNNNTTTSALSDEDSSVSSVVDSSSGNDDEEDHHPIEKVKIMEDREREWSGCSCVLDDCFKKQ